MTVRYLSAREARCRVCPARLQQRDLDSGIPWLIQLYDQTYGALVILRLFAARLPGPLRNCIIAVPPANSENPGKHGIRQDTLRRLQYWCRESCRTNGQFEPVWLIVVFILLHES